MVLIVKCHASRGGKHIPMTQRSLFVLVPEEEEGGGESYPSISLMMTYPLIVMVNKSRSSSNPTIDGVLKCIFTKVTLNEQ